LKSTLDIGLWALGFGLWTASPLPLDTKERC
jgi:hypothetical protein